MSKSSCCLFHCPQSLSLSPSVSLSLSVINFPLWNLQSAAKRALLGATWVLLLRERARRGRNERGLTVGDPASLGVICGCGYKESHTAVGAVYGGREWRGGLTKNLDFFLMMSCIRDTAIHCCRPGFLCSPARAPETIIATILCMPMPQ